MEIHFTPDLQAKVDQLVVETGREPEELLEDALAGYVAELAQPREMLNNLYDDVRSDKVKLVSAGEVKTQLDEMGAA